jgi:hypothetical protein
MIAKGLRDKRSFVEPMILWLLVLLIVFILLKLAERG